MAKVTIVIPCYNHGAYLAETLNSVQKQTFQDYETVVVNDGSTDHETMRFLQHLELPKTRVIHTANLGVSSARNRAIREAQGDYILPLDSDDLIGPSYLEKAVPVLDADSDVGVVYCERVLFGEKEGIIALPRYDRRALLVNNLIYPAALFRKSDWGKVGGYNEKMVYGWEDWDFWISLSALNKRVVKLPEKLFYYRVRSCSRDHSLRFMKKLIMFMLMLFRHKKLYARNILYVFSRILLNKVYDCRKLETESDHA